MKNVSVKDLDIIENVKSAIKPKSIFKAFWDMIGGKPESIEQTDAQKEALEIYYTNNEKNIDRLEKLMAIPEKPSKSGRKVSKSKYEINSKAREQERTKKTLENKAEKVKDDDYVK